MKRKLFLLIAAIAALCRFHAQPSPTYFATGLQPNNSLLPVGQPETHWKVSNSGPGGTYGTAYKAPPHSGVWAPENTGGNPSGWISYKYSCNSDFTDHGCLSGIQNLYYRIDFPLPVNPILTLNWMLYGDDVIADIYVNSTATPAWSNPNGGPAYNNYTYTAGISFRWCDSWQPGNNYIIVHTVSGIHPSTFDLTGLMVVPIGVSNLSISGNTLVCMNTTNQYSVAPVSGGNSYLWYQSNFSWTGTSSLNHYNLTVNNVPSVVFVKAYSGYSCLGSGSLQVNIAPNPLVAASASSASVCSGFAVNLTGSGASTYTWFPGNGTGSPYAGHPTVPTTYTVTGTSAIGCTANATTTVGILPDPVVQASASTASVCPGYSVTLSASGASSYHWQAPVPAPNAANNPVTLNPGPGFATAYNVIGTAVNGCTASAAVSVGMLPLPSVGATSSPPFMCAGVSNTLSANGAVSYTWLPGPFTATYVVGATSSPTTYWVQGMAANGCTNVASITLNNGPLIPLTAPTILLCTDISSCVTLSVSTSFTAGSVSYSWLPQPLPNVPNPTVCPPPFTVPLYTVTATSSAGCPTQTVQAVFSTTCCPPPVGRFYIKPFMGCHTTYTDLAQYAFPTGTLSGLGVTYNASLNQYDFNANGNLQAGTYTITFTYTTAPYGCTYHLQQTVTLISPMPLSATSSATSICAGSGTSPVLGATLSGVQQQGTQYTWTPGGAMGQSITVTPTVTTIYTVDIITGDCVSEATTVVNFSSICCPTCCPPTGGATFQMPPSVICNATFRDLQQYASVTGTFSGVGVTYDNGLYVFNHYEALPPGTYTITFTYTNTNGCTYTLEDEVSIIAGGTYPLYANAAITRCYYTQGGATLVATSNAPNGTVYNWSDLTHINLYLAAGATPALPVQTPTAVVNPTETTVYGVSFMINNCVSYATTTVYVNYTCCPQTAYTPELSSNVLSAGGTLTGPMVINQDITIGNGPGTFQMQGGEFIINTGVKITVQPGINLVLTDVHLYSCNNYMWQGIVLQDGANVTSAPGTKNTLIEDAEIGIDVNNITSGHAVPLLDLDGVVFNRNYIGIKLHNSSLTKIPIKVRSCVFTSRNFGENISWPNASTSSPDLRYETPGAASSLSSPFVMQNFVGSNIKFPHSLNGLVPSYAGLQIENIGNVSGGNPDEGVNMMAWASPAASEFNLFDNLMAGIDITDGSLTTINNVFQNVGVQMPIACINQNITGQMNARLNLAPDANAQPGTGNQFWNFNIGVNAVNVYDVDIEQASFRALPVAYSFDPGLSGVSAIVLKSNRFNYTINNNEFIDLAAGVSIGLTPGFYQTNTVTDPNGIYKGFLNINQNFFSPEISMNTNNSVNTFWHPISVFGSNNCVWQSYNGTNGIIQSNNIDRCYNGITVDGMKNYPVTITGNTVQRLLDVPPPALAILYYQFGISLTNSTGYKSITKNTVNSIYSNYGAKQIRLIYGGNNSYSQFPWDVCSVSCNTVSNAWVGFYFTGMNICGWSSNYMSHLGRGLDLDMNAVIGGQGFSGHPCGNVWVNSPWTSNETYVEGGSLATQSPLTVAPGDLSPSANHGGQGASNDYNITGAINFTSGPAVYDCSEITNPAPPSQRLAAPTGIFANSSAQSYIHVFPNPTNGCVTISNENENEQLEVKVLDVTGKLILHKVINDNTDNTLDLSLLTPAMYFVEVQTGSKEVIRTKLIKE